MTYRFKIAETPEEYDGLRRLNHLAFAEELGQHEPTENGLLVDRFEDKSAYLIAVQGREVTGMIATHSQPPWSIESRLPSLDPLRSLPQPLMEVRLLCIHPAHRNSMVIAGLLGRVLIEARERGVGSLIISGFADRVEMYEHLGFRALGPAVPHGRALFVPMALPIREVPDRIWRELALYEKRIARG
jgi:hypothetical protein